MSSVANTAAAAAATTTTTKDADDKPQIVRFDCRNAYQSFTIHEYSTSSSIGSAGG